MEALQTVAGRLAHDLNNPLMIVTGYSEEILESLPADHPVHKAVVEILAGAQRIASVAARFTEFARKNANPAQPVDLTQLLASLQDRIKQAAGVACSVELPGGPVVALTDGGQLEKVILTLASQNLESARERSRLTVSCSMEGPHASISLSDNGRGLDPLKQAGIFESGLTAKMDSPEAQSGMALARAYSLVRQWGGDIAFSSRPTGSEYRIYLPLRSESRATPPQPAPAANTPAILVVDDEAGIRGLVLKFLRREGYRVLEAASAEEALKVSRGERVNLLVTDVMLPGLQGSELARKMYEANSNLKVLYISGYTSDESVRSGAFPPGAGFLAKPFTLAALLEKVRAALPQRLA
jgi:CheY-like chemotaxis protein